MIVYTIIKRPYIRLYDNLRSAWNYLLLCLATLSVLLYINIPDFRKNAIYPLLLEIGLLIGIIFAYVVVIRDIVKNYKSKPEENLAFELCGDDEVIKKLR